MFYQSSAVFYIYYGANTVMFHKMLRRVVQLAPPPLKITRVKRINEKWMGNELPRDNPGYGEKKENRITQLLKMQNKLNKFV